MEIHSPYMSLSLHITGSNQEVTENKNAYQANEIKQRTVLKAKKEYNMLKCR